jgi:RNase P subunit RPR2
MPEKSIWLDEAILQIFKTLKRFFCSSCDGVPLKFKKKNVRASSLPAQIISCYYNSLDNTFN